MSSSSSPSSSDGDDGGGRGGEFEGPSSSRLRANDGVWPEPFVENLAYQVAIDAARSFGRLAAGPAIANVFLVCSTWHTVSRSDPLWENLTRQIWARDSRQQDTWREEYVYRHRTADNFRTGDTQYTTLDYDASENGDGLACRCLALSDFYLACGFVNGSVRLFDLSTRLHVGTFLPHPHDGLGPFSRAVSGIVLADLKLVFASLSGDIHVATIQAEGTRRVQLGNVLINGTLVDFTGDRRWWVGLFAGVAGQAFHIWDGENEQLMFVGGSLTDQESVMGWHMLTDLSDSIGRVRVTNQESAVAYTGLRSIVFDLRNHGLVLHEEEFVRSIIVDSVDVHNDLVLTVNNRRMARVRRVDNLEEVCRFRVRVTGGSGAQGVWGCINGGYAIILSGGVLRTWEVQHGQFLYTFRERIGDVTALIANERHVAACSTNSSVHLWDFGAL